ncbi:MAG: galactokinase [Erysipelotrichaceae bacterium]|nr:galactokinase [Erysipelotrichaceae bacterium]
MDTKLLRSRLENDGLKERLLDIYLDESQLDYQKQRYLKALDRFEELYGPGEVMVISVPGRSEVGGNHTDHQHGKVLACGINLDIIALMRRADDIDIVSDDRVVRMSMDELSYVKKEERTTRSLVKGVVKRLATLGYQTGGFHGFLTSDVLVGSGMSSSAAFEVIIGSIINYLYNDGKIDGVEIAKASQIAENVYFGKPCGLMDQMACSLGNLINIDFADNDNPVVHRVEVDFSRFSYSLCIVDTKGSHASLTDEYAAIPEEMKKVAAVLGHTYVSELNYEDVIDHIDEIREKCGDRAVLRAIHVLKENGRVDQQVSALEEGRFADFLDLVRASGDSSYKYLQNVFACKDYNNQSVSLGLLVSELALGDNGVCRVHGSGFAGSIQAFVKDSFVAEYKKQIERVFGEGSCHVLKVRKYGGLKVID